MRSRQVMMKKSDCGISVVCACVFSLWIVMSFASPVFADTPEVELYQDAKGEWKLKQLNSQPVAQQSDTGTNGLTAEIEGATDVDLYQDDSGEWKVRYVKSGKPVEIPEVAAKKETEVKAKAAEKPADPKEDNKVAIEKTAKEISAVTVEKTAVTVPVQPAAKPKPAPVAEPVVILTDEESEENFAVVEEVSTNKVSMGELSPFDTAYGEVARRNENNLWEVGVEVLSHKFEQEIFMNNLDFTQGKTNEGMLYGLHLGYEHIFAQNPPNRSFKDIIQNFDNINRYKVTADYRFGPTTYSQGGDSSPLPEQDFTQQTLEVRGVGGYDFIIADKTRLTPFIGLGYRYTHDPSGGFLDIPPKGLEDNTGKTFTSVFYDPVTDTADIVRAYSSHLHAFYLPVGLMTNSDVTEDLSLGLNMEFDYVFLGVQRSSFSKLGPLYYADVGDDTISLKNFSNKLKGGIGLKGAVRVTKKQNKFDWYIEPYIRYWHLRKNEKQYELLLSDGTTGILYHDVDNPVDPYKHIEPENSTTEYGLQVGVVF